MYTYKGIVENVVDGDTIDVLIDLGFKTITKQRMRLAHVDTPERGQAGYKEASALTRELVLEKEVTLRSQKVSKWGYYLVEITLADGSDLAQTLIARGVAKPYEGGKKE